MQCPKCKIEMEQGNLIVHGTKWVQNNGKRGGFGDNMAGLMGGLPVIAWRCPSCKEIKLVTL